MSGVWRASVVVASLLLPAALHAAAVDDCIARAVREAAAGTPVEAIRRQCDAPVAQGGEGAEPVRLAEFRRLEADPHALLPLRLNYILPITYNPEPNQAPYESPAGNEPVREEEVKLQVSLKFPLTSSDLFTAGDGIYFGFTMKSFWQLYNKEFSSPFRETNYRPEVFYQRPLLIRSDSGAWYGRVGLEHESNGRTQVLSRSWNRTYVTLGYAEDTWEVALQPWYRLPEEAKVDDGDPMTPPPPEGDDNPYIDDYMGRFELTGAYRWQQLEFSALLRRNFNEGRGAVEVGVDFPLWGRLRGYAQYFDGYGESLIDYDYRNQRIGLGFLFSGAL